MVGLIGRDHNLSEITAKQWLFIYSLFIYLLVLGSRGWAFDWHSFSPTNSLLILYCVVHTLVTSYIIMAHNIVCYINLDPHMVWWPDFRVQKAKTFRT